MAANKLTFKRKNEILMTNGETFLQRIDTGTMCMAQLVDAKVITAFQSQNIQAAKIPGDMRTALFNHFLSAEVEPFIDFCIVLYDKQHKRDIVVEEFGLNIADLRHQKEQIQKKKTDASMQENQPAMDKESPPPTSGGTSAAQTYPIWDERNLDEQTILKKTPLYEKVKNNYDELVEIVRLDNLWAKFRRYDVINIATEQRIRAEKTSADMVYKLMQVLETSHSWRFHAFSKALCADNQEACVELLGLDAAIYK